MRELMSSAQVPHQPAFNTENLDDLHILIPLCARPLDCKSNTFATNDTPSTARFPSSSLVSTTPESIPSSSSFFASELNAKKKKAVVEEEPEREKNNPLGLLIVYMTPWRNPNSIFVYMFGIVYALGKYSEAQAIARDSGVL
eukprot:jgi/Psemu1/2584/gm1.2584_g